MSVTEGLSYVLCRVCWNQLELPRISCVQHKLTLGLFSQRPLFQTLYYQSLDTYIKYFPPVTDNCAD